MAEKSDAGNGENDDSTRITVRLDGELSDALESERTQGRYNIPKTEVVRAALEEYLVEDEPGEHEGNGSKCPA